MKKLRFILPLFLFVALIGGCKYRDVLVLIKDGANSTQSFERSVIKANHDHFIDDATEVSLLNFDKLLVNEDDAAADAILAQHDAQGAIGHIDTALASIDSFILNDLAGIKNAGLKTDLHAVLLALRGTLVTAKALLTK